MNFKKMSAAELENVHFQFVARGNFAAAREVGYYKTHYNRRVRVVKGRKVPKGTTGTVFHISTFCRSKYGDPWGIYTTYSVGIKDDAGAVYWTNVDNVEVIDD